MGGYIGARAGSLSTTTVANVQDVTATDTTPEVTIINNTHEDTDGGREGKVIFKGQQSGGEESTLAEIQGSHDGTSDDEKGDLIFKTNDGSDGSSPTERLRIDSAGLVTITNASNDAQLRLESTDADASFGPKLNMYRNSSSPADNDLLGNIEFEGRNDNSQDVVYGRLFSKISDASDGTEDGVMRFDVMKAGALSDVLTFFPSELVVNDGSYDYDFRVESNDDANAFHLRASDSKVAINNNDFLSTLHVRDTGANSGSLRVGGNGASLGLELTYDQSGATTSIIQANPTYTSTSSLLKIRTDGDGNPDQLVLNGGGDILFGTTSTVLDGKITSNFAGNARRGLTLNDTTSTNTVNFVAFALGGSEIGKIQKNSGASSVNYSTTSDYRLKENEENISDGITRVKQLKPYKFNWKAYPEANKVDGFFAHEVSTVVPEAVNGEKDAVDDTDNIKPQGIDPSKLVPVLTAALQEAIAKIETLETKVAALEG